MLARPDVGSAGGFAGSDPVRTHLSLSEGRVTAWLIVLAILAASLVVRWTILEERWINPDEGAYLADAALALEGLRPGVDYEARGPLHVYALAATLKVTGHTLFGGRILSLVCSLLTGLVLFLLGTELVDRRVGLLASALYLLLPLEVLQSVVVKTEAPATLLIVSSLYCAVLGAKRRRGGWLLAAGILAAMGYYVRQTALLLLPIVPLFLILLHESRHRAILKSLGLFVAGYASVLLVAAAWYARWLGIASLPWVTPVGFLTGSWHHLLGLLRRSGPAPAASPVPVSDSLAGLQAPVGREGIFGESQELYLFYLKDVFDFHSFLLAGLALSIVWLVWSPTRRKMSRDERVALIVSYSWIAVLALMYLYRYVARGFFIDYFREFLPALVIVLSVWLCRTVPALRQAGGATKFTVAAVPGAAGWFLLQRAYPEQFGIGHHATLAAALLAIIMVAGSRPKRWQYLVTLSAIGVWIVLSRQVWSSSLSGVVPSIVTMVALFVMMAGWFRSRGGEPLVKRMTEFAGLALVASTTALSLSYSALRLGVSYEAVWPPAEAREISETISGSTDPEAEVLSGAVIWSFLASRRPYLLESHPLRMKAGLSPVARAELRSELVANPPEIVVMDGYTEQTFALNAPLLDTLVAAEYVEISRSHEGFRPVAVYRLSATGLRLETTP